MYSNITLKQINGSYKDTICSQSTLNTVKRLIVSININNDNVTTSFIVSTKTNVDQVFNNVSEALDYYNSIK